MTDANAHALDESASRSIDRGIPSIPAPLAPPPLARLTLADQVRDYLVLEIAQGRLAPGDAIRELEIAERLGTSQTPVREALRELAALGLIDSKRHVGARVRSFGDQDLIDGVPVRAALEGLAGRQAVTASAEALQVVRDAFDRLLEVARGGDRLEYAAASTEFHRCVIRASGNVSLERAWNALGIEVMTILATAGNDGSLTESAEAHREILDAVESGDADLAERVLTEHQTHYLPRARHRAE
jgi:DNA-binding GntR family transcriptional regulator